MCENDLIPTEPFPSWAYDEEKKPTNLPTQPLPLHCLCSYVFMALSLRGCCAELKGWKTAVTASLFSLYPSGSEPVVTSAKVLSMPQHGSQRESCWALVIFHIVMGMSSLQGAPWCIHLFKGRLANHYHYFISTLHSSYKYLQGQMNFPLGPSL